MQMNSAAPKGLFYMGGYIVRVIFTSEGKAFSDFEIYFMMAKKREAVEAFFSKEVVKISSAVVIGIIQVYIREGILQAKDVVLEMNQNEFYFADNGETLTPIFSVYIDAILEINEQLTDISKERLEQTRIYC